MIEARRLHELFHLDQETGRIYWKERGAGWHSTERARLNFNKRFANKEAFTAIDSHGYRHGQLLGRMCLAHRVVFALRHGRWPEGAVDHIDGDRTNNRPDNLREATGSQNKHNQHKVVGQSRFRGVTRHKCGKWQASATSNDGRLQYLGLFGCETSAALAFDQYALKHRGDFAKTNFDHRGVTP